MAEKSNDVSQSDAATSPQQDDDNAGGGWWDSWISSARNKSAEVYSMVKKDLDEIGSAVKSEASHVFSTTSNVIGKTFKLDEPQSPANVMKKSFSSFIGQVSTVLNPEPDDEDDTEVILSSGDTTMLSTYKKELEALQRVDATFIVPASGPEFEAWRAAREPAPPAAPARRLGASAVLRAQYRRLVPDAVTHEHFWEWYLFRVALLQDRLAAAARRTATAAATATATATADPVLAHLPLQTNNVIQESPKKVAPESPVKEYPSATDFVAWEDEDFANDVELTEEQQTLLLEEYEKEITSKKQTKQTTTRETSNNTKNKTTNTRADKKSKMAQTRDKANNRQSEKRPNRQQKATPKADECGNNMVEDYFAEKDAPAQVVKDDASAHSDESWEKEFDIDEVTPKV